MIYVDPVEDDRLRFREYKAKDNSCIIRVTYLIIRKALALSSSQEIEFSLKEISEEAGEIPRYEISLINEENE